MFRNTRNGAWYFHFFRACFNFVSKRFETTETFGLSQFSSCFSPFQFFPYIIHCFSVSKHQKWGLVFSLFPELVSVLFWNVWPIFFTFQSSFKTVKQLNLLDLAILQKFIFLYSLIVSMFQCFTETKCMPWVCAGVLCRSYIFNRCTYVFEPPYDKTNKMTVCPVTTQIRLGGSAWASAQSDQNLRCPHEKTLVL